MVTLHTPAKVADLDDVALFNKDIFRLDISMDEALFVHIIDARANLNKEVKSGILTKILLLADEVE